MTVVVTILFFLVVGALLWSLADPMGMLFLIALIAVALGLLPFETFRHAVIVVISGTVHLLRDAWVATMAAVSSSH